MKNTERMLRGLLEAADIKIGGNRPQDIIVHNDAVYDKVIGKGSLGLGESYMDRDWDANDLPRFLEQVLRARLESKMQWNWVTVSAIVTSRLLNKQNLFRAKRVAKEHYDLKGILPSPLLDPYNQYSCAYFKDTDDLNTAQEQKMKLICEKLQLKKGDRLLDIGCGWGGLAKYAAEHYGCSVTGLSISEEQIKYAREFCKGLPVEILNCDYRNPFDGMFDKIASVGMMEHVGYKNYGAFFRAAHAHLKQDGLFLLHTIGGNVSTTIGEAFLDKYIFPGGMLPSQEQLYAASAGLFNIQDLQNLALNYPKTLLAWYKNMEAHWDELSKIYDDRFHRMFEYYLLSCKGIFDSGETQLWQMVFTKFGTTMDYIGPR